MLDCFCGKTVWVSGATGFKGSWLCEWLLSLGAKVHGFSQEPNTQPSLFEQLGLAKRIKSEIGDIRDAGSVSASLVATAPDFIFHLAAQPLVRLSYEQPVQTYEANVMGTINVLEALRRFERPCVAVFITTDKCYENREWMYAYREEDSLGGYDPYSSSKAMAEIAISAYRRSYFQNHAVKIASARAGNVMGGGDWALDRIVPDAVRALSGGEPVPVRNKHATRPWQHVLEPLSGYLLLASEIMKASRESDASRLLQLCSAFNFGPALSSNRTVHGLVIEILKHWPGEWVDRSNPQAVHEAGRLNLATDKAFHILGWKPVWDFERNVEESIMWYRKNHVQNGGIHEMTINQIRTYTETATALGLPWAAERSA